MPSLSIASIAHTARLAVLGSFLILTLPAAQAAELPNSAELQYVGPYHVPVNMTFNRTGNTYAVALRIHVPLYQIRFQSSGSISNNTLRPAVYMDTRNGKPYAEAHFSGHDVRYGKTGAEIQTSALNGPTFDLFSLAWQLAMNDGRLPAKLHITNGKKIYAVSGIRKIGDDMYRLGERDIAISRYQIQRNDSSMEYAFEDGAKDLSKLSRRDLDNARQKIQIVFQDPYSSLNPVLTIFSSLEDPLIKFGVKNKQERVERIGKLLEDVNLPREYMSRYPNEFSGGQRQRIGIARALSVKPELIICDEAVSALDVSIQAQVLKLLNKLKEERGLTYIFITHDLSVVEYLADRIAVMYLGRIVELTSSEELFANPLHPYTKALLSAVPVPRLEAPAAVIRLPGETPSPANPPTGCHFHPRCPQATDVCRQRYPETCSVSATHTANCHLLG